MDADEPGVITDDEDGDYNRRGDRYGRDDPLNRLKRETIKIAESVSCIGEGEASIELTVLAGTGED